MLLSEISEEWTFRVPFVFFFVLHLVDGICPLPGFLSPKRPTSVQTLPKY